MMYRSADNPMPDYPKFDRKTPKGSDNQISNMIFEFTSLDVCIEDLMIQNGTIKNRVPTKRNTFPSIYIKRF